MRASFNIMLLQLTIFLRQHGNLVGLIVIPVGFTVAIGFASGGFADEEGDDVRIDVIDYDESALSAQLLNDLRESNPRFVLCPFDNDVDDRCNLDEIILDDATITERLEDATALAYIEIPLAFETSVQSGAPVEIIYRANENITAPSFILQAVQTVTQRMSATLVAATAGTQAANNFPGVDFVDEDDRLAFADAVRTRAANIWTDNPISINYVLSDTDEDDSSQIGFGQSVPGMGTMFVMFTVFGGIFGLVQQRHNWTLQRLVTLPISNAQILGGLILAFFVLGMIQYSVVFLVGVAAGLDLGSDLLAIALIMMSFTLTTAGLTFVLANYVRTDQQAGSITTLLGLTLAPLGGAWWPLEIVPDFMRTVGHLSPVAWAMDGFRELIFFDGTLSDVWMYILILLGYAIVLFAFGVYRFSYE